MRADRQNRYLSRGRSVSLSSEFESQDFPVFRVRTPSAEGDAPMSNCTRGAFPAHSLFAGGYGHILRRDHRGSSFSVGRRSFDGAFIIKSDGTLNEADVDWNGQFQQIVQSIHAFTANTPTSAQRQTYQKLIRLAEVRVLMCALSSARDFCSLRAHTGRLSSASCICPTR
jgi:hypothetical protein